MQPIILKLSDMENPKDFLSKEELNLVTGGISPSGIFANNEGDAGRGPSCDAGCKKGCVPGCRPGCAPGCVLISGKDGYKTS